MTSRCRSAFVALFAAALLFITLAAAPALAREMKMLFWYPGEAGSTAEAQPILDAFFEHLNPKLAPDMMAGRYLNSVEAGLAAIAKERPTAAIVSYAAWRQHQRELGRASVILSTLPLPGGAPMERYALVGKSRQLPPNPTILSSEPLSSPFVRSELFPSLPEGARLETTPQMIAKLKEISEGRLAAAAILTPTEFATLGRLSAPWAKGISLIEESRHVPTARVLLLDPAWPGAEKLKDALAGMGADPGARELLQEMRLAGFQEETLQGAR